MDIETGAHIEINFSKLRSPECIKIDGKAPAQPTFAASLDFDLSKERESLPSLPVLTIKQYILPASLSYRECVQRGYFIAEDDWREFDEWRRLRSEMKITILE